MDAFKASVRAKLTEEDITDEELQALFSAGYRTLKALGAARPGSLSSVKGLSLGAQDLVMANFSGQCTQVVEMGRQNLHPQPCVPSCNSFSSFQRRCLLCSHVSLLHIICTNWCQLWVFFR